MALSERLMMVIQANGAQAVSEFNKVGTAAERDLARAENSSKRLGAQLTRVGVGFVTMGGLAAFGMYKAGQAAADLEQAVGGTEAVFGVASSTIDDFATNAAESMGLSEQAFRDGTTRIGALLTNMGYSQDEAANKSIEMAQAAADLAATVGGDTTEALHAMGRALVGEFDPLESYAVSLRQADINARAVAMGLATSTESVSQNARAQAALALITERSSFAQGQFAVESDTASGSAAILSAQWQNLVAQLGAGALPVMTRVTGGLRSMVSGFSAANSASGGLLAQVATWGSVGAIAVGGMLLLAGQVLKLGTTFRTLMNTTMGVRIGLLALNPAFSGVAAAVGIAAAAYVAFSQNSTEMEIDVRRLAALTDGEMRSGLENMLTALRALGQEDQIFGALSDAADQDIVAAERMGEALVGLGVDAERVDRILRDAAEANLAQGANAEGAAAANERLAGGLNEGAEAAQAQADALDELMTEIDEYLSSIHDVPAAQDALQESFQTLEESLRENQGAWQGDTEAARANREAGRAVVEGFAELIGKMKEQNATQGELQYVTGTSIGRLRALRDQGVITGGQFTELRRQILNTPGAVNINVNSNVRSVLADWQALPAAIKYAADTANAVNIPASIAAPPAGGRAHGGFVRDGESSRVHDGEIVTQQNGRTVVTSASSVKSNGMGGGLTQREANMIGKAVAHELMMAGVG